MKQVRVGVGVFIVKDDGAFLMYQRRGSHGHGEWSTPGGHVEFGETWRQCAVREVKEETGLDIAEKNVELVGITDDFFNSDNKQYVTVIAKVKWNGQKPKQMEPNKGSEWEWRTLENLPKPLFTSMIQIFEQNISLEV